MFIVFVMRQLAIIVMLVLAWQVQAEVYKSVTADGEVIYSDKPTQGAKQLKMPSLPTYTPPPAPQMNFTPENSPEKQAVYNSFEFITPTSEETVRNNLGILNIEVQLSPPLQNKLNHRVQFYLDGKPYGPALGKTSLTISDLDRGEHTVSAAVVDVAGETLISTGNVTVYMKRHSILNPPFNTPKPTPLPSGKS